MTVLRWKLAESSMMFCFRLPLRTIRKASGRAVGRRARGPEHGELPQASHVGPCNLVRGGFDFYAPCVRSAWTMRSAAMTGITLSSAEWYTATGSFCFDSRSAKACSSRGPCA